MIQSPINSPNIDPLELAKFDQLATRWWDAGGDFKPLHDINPLRLSFIERFSPLAGLNIVDIGCGGGILTESLALKAAIVTGCDMSEGPLKVAKLHLLESGLEVEYLKSTAEALADERPESFDVVTCMEMLEHVPDPASVINACARLVKPGGQVFFSTLARNIKSYLYAIIGAEYMLKLLPKGTHDYQKFIQPSEMAAWCRSSGLSLTTLTGMTYNPLFKTYRLNPNDVSVNYLARCVKEN